MKPFRFGIIDAQARSGAEWTAAARRYESMGIDVLQIPDTIHTLAAPIAAAVAATATTTLRVAPWVLSAPNRSPGQVAHETATLDTLTGGRYQLGIGTGRPGADRDAAVYGHTFGTPGERLALLREVVLAVHERTPQVPVLIAAGGPKALAQAGELADLVTFAMPSEVGEDELSQALALLRAGAGDRMETIELAANIIQVGDAPLGGPDRPSFLQPPENPDAIAALRGSTQQIVDTLQRRRERFGLSCIVTAAVNAEAFAPVVERLAGR